MTKTELSHTSICLGCARLSLEKFFAVFAKRTESTALQSVLTLQRQIRIHNLIICNVEFAEVPHAIESHMNLCNCAEESAVKICQGRRVEGAKIWEKSLCRPARKTCNKLNSLMRCHYNHTAFISISVLQSVTCY